MRKARSSVSQALRTHFASKSAYALSVPFCTAGASHEVETWTDDVVIICDVQPRREADIHVSGFLCLVHSHSQKAMSIRNSGKRKTERNLEVEARVLKSPFLAGRDS